MQKIRLITGFLTGLMALLMTNVAAAQVLLPDYVRPDTLRTVQGNDIEDQAARLTGEIVLTAIQFAGAIAVIFIVVAGFRYVLSRGDDGEVGNAKNALVWTIVALVILILAYSIVSTVFNLAGSFA